MCRLLLQAYSNSSSQNFQQRVRAKELFWGLIGCKAAVIGKYLLHIVHEANKWVERNAKDFPACTKSS